MAGAAIEPTQALREMGLDGHLKPETFGFDTSESEGIWNSGFNPDIQEGRAGFVGASFASQFAKLTVFAIVRG